jgi:hypothetical protein
MSKLQRPEGLGYSVFALRAIGNAHKKTSKLQAPKAQKDANRSSHHASALSLAIALVV